MSSQFASWVSRTNSAAAAAAAQSSGSGGVKPAAGPPPRKPLQQLRAAGPLPPRKPLRWQRPAGFRLPPAREVPGLVVSGIGITILCVCLLACGGSAVSLWSAADAATYKTNDALQLSYAVAAMFLGFGAGLVFELLTQNRFVSGSALFQKFVVLTALLFITVIAVYTMTKLRSLRDKTGEALNDEYLSALPLYFAIAAFGFGFFGGLVLSFVQEKVGTTKFVIPIIVWNFAVWTLVAAAAANNIYLSHRTKQSCWFGVANTNCNRTPFLVSASLLIVSGIGLIATLIVTILLAVFAQAAFAY
jgi:hypothetical protein